MSDFPLIECYELNTMIKVSSWFNNLPECLIEFKMPRKIQINRISVRLRTKIFTHSSFANSTRPRDLWELCERVCTWASRAGLMRSMGCLVSIATPFLLPSCLLFKVNEKRSKGLGALFGVFSDLLGQHISGTYPRRKVTRITWPETHQPRAIMRPID